MSGLALFHHWKPLFQDTCWIWCVLASGGCGFAWLLAFSHGQAFKAKATSVKETSPLVPMYFFLGTHCGGRRCALPPAPPHPLSFFNRLPLLPTLFPFLSASFLWVHLLFLNLYLYPSPLVPMCFFLGTHCGGRRCALVSALPPAPPHPLLLLNQLHLLHVGRYVQSYINTWRIVIHFF